MSVSDDVIAMYKKGLSIDYIVNTIYKEKLNNTSNVIKVGSMVIVKNNKPKKIDTRKEVEGIILSCR